MGFFSWSLGPGVLLEESTSSGSSPIMTVVAVSLMSRSCGLYLSSAMNEHNWKSVHK